MYINYKQLLSSLTKEDIVKICESLGNGNYKEDSNGNLCFSTSLCHGGDSPYKLLYYPNEKSGTFHCYTCGMTTDVINFVINSQRLRGKTYTFYKAIKYIANVTGKVNFETEFSQDVQTNYLINDWDWINRIKSAQRNSKAIPNLSEINENILDIFYYAPHEEWLNDNITREALSTFEIGYYGLTNQITIPHRDINHRLLGIRGRYLDKDDIENIGKYVPLQIDGKFLSHSLGSNLYGISQSGDTVKKYKKCMLVESEKSCLQSYSYFGEDSFTLAVCGSNISLTQRKILLNSLDCEEIILAFDKEYTEPNSFEADLYLKKLVRLVEPILNYCKVSLVLDTKGYLDKKDSPTDKGKDILLKLLDEKYVLSISEAKKILNRE